ncbi:MAG: hypothetical protein F4X18_01855 [Acidimicrobiia bacterium]|nr:hypothetical protein [Acidimicrobiia bacterium]
MKAVLTPIEQRRMMVIIDDMADDQLYVMRITPGNGPMDPELAASLDDVRKAAARDPNRWRNNPEKKRKALEGMGKLLAEWQQENGAFTEEELARARASMYGP